MLSKHEWLLAPKPKKMELGSGIYAVSGDCAIGIGKSDEEVVRPAAKRLQTVIRDELQLRLKIRHDGFGGEGHIRFLRRPGLLTEAYMLEIGPNGISIEYGDGAGAFHAVVTIKQMARQFHSRLPFVRIEDKPDFPVRGVMLDISRNKISTMATLYRLIDFLADLKINHLQLYIEGFSFAYPSFPQVWEGRTPVTGEEMELLDRYCKDRYIDFVPNQNSFGHMVPWLKRDEFIHLAECPDGFDAPWGRYESSMSLNPVSEESLRFIEQIYDDLLPHFSSPFFNVGCDETFDLGKGWSKEACERLGKGKVYLKYLLQIYELCKKRGKTMMFWGDIIKEHPELVPELPKDVIALEWGYESDQPSEEQCALYAKTGIPFYVCPGTSSWNSITGLTENMKQNIRNAAVYGKKYGARGLINTDWGDAGHWQPTPASYPGILYGAVMGWGVERNIHLDIGEALNRMLFRDTTGRMGDLAVDFGNYYLCEKPTKFNGSGIFRTLYYAQLDDTNRTLDFLNLPDLDRNDFEGVRHFVTGLMEQLDRVEMQCDDAELIKSEYKHAGRLILHGVKLGLFKLGGLEGEARAGELKRLILDLQEIVSELKVNWLSRNRSGGLEDSLTGLYGLLDQYRMECLVS